MAEPVIMRLWNSDAVVVSWGREWFRVYPDGTTESQFSEPNAREVYTIDEEDAVVRVLETLGTLGLSKSSWKKITQHFGGEYTA